MFPCLSATLLKNGYFTIAVGTDDSAKSFQGAIRQDKYHIPVLDDANILL